MKINRIEGLQKDHAKVLKNHDIMEVEDLTKIGWDELENIAEKSDLSLKLLHEWQEKADLMSLLKGVGPEYADALIKIGIDSVMELSHRNAENISEKIEKLNEEHPELLGRLPTLESIKDWIDQAEEKYESEKEKKGPGTKLIKIEGIGDTYAKDLKMAGYETAEQLAPLSKNDLANLAEKTGISAKLLDKWQAHTNLMLIKGVGPEYADLLYQINFKSVEELENQDPEELLEKIKDFNEKNPRVIQRLPVLNEVRDWIQQV
jgi:predicted flap endonuclease-1-like 5' DNA nuclease